MCVFVYVCLCVNGGNQMDDVMKIRGEAGMGGMGGEKREICEEYTFYLSTPLLPL